MESDKVELKKQSLITFEFCFVLRCTGPPGWVLAWLVVHFLDFEIQFSENPRDNVAFLQCAVGIKLTLFSTRNSLSFYRQCFS